MTTNVFSTPNRRAILGAAAAAAGTIAMPSVLRARQIEWIAPRQRRRPISSRKACAQSLDVFAARLKALTKGQINITAQHAGALGGERENVEALLQGASHVATPGAAGRPAIGKRMVGEAGLEPAKA